MAGGIKERTVDPRPFQDWLRGELDARGWTPTEFSRNIKVHKTTVNKWLVEPDNPNHTLPSYGAIMKMAAVLGSDVGQILDLVGLPIDPKDGELTPVQRDIATIASLLPDDLLLPVRAQMRALTDLRLQREIRQRVAELEAPDDVITGTFKR